MINEESKLDELIGGNDIALGSISAMDLYGMSEDELMNKIRTKLYHPSTNVNAVYNYLLPFLYSARSVFTIRNRYANVRKQIESLRISAERKDNMLEIFKLDDVFISM